MNAFADRQGYDASALGAVAAGGAVSAPLGGGTPGQDTVVASASAVPLVKTEPSPAGVDGSEDALIDAVLAASQVPPTGDAPVTSSASSVNLVVPVAAFQPTVPPPPALSTAAVMMIDPVTQQPVYA